MLAGLIKDLNITTRFGGLSVAADATANAAAMTSAWMTALPLRVSFARGRPAHDPWQHDARRLVETGEADTVVWIAAFDEPPPEWLGGVPSGRSHGPGHALRRPECHHDPGRPTGPRP